MATEQSFSSRRMAATSSTNNHYRFDLHSRCSAGLIVHRQRKLAMQRLASARWENAQRGCASGLSFGNESLEAMAMTVWVLHGKPVAWSAGSALLLHRHERSLRAGRSSMQTVV